MVRILSGDAEGDVDSIIETAKGGETIDWIVPKTPAERGE